ncbi:MAG TPA: sensor domain-containing protein [Streptosporangiaceae bacterium]|nr:sensor domain-containing protein [Streptosporangiaceae bacterium]
MTVTWRAGGQLTANPLRLAFSGGLWRSARYLLVYVFGTGWVLFSAAFTVVTTAVVFAVTLAGIPLLSAAAGVLRGCAAVERGRLRDVFAEPVRGRYRPVPPRGMLAQAGARWKDPATWRALTYLVALWAPLFALDTAVLTVWLTFLAGVTIPLWYWAPVQISPIGYTNGAPVHGIAYGYFPHGPYGPGAWGYFVDSLPKALLAALVFLILFLLFSYVVVLTARAHGRVARALLRAPADPLAAARDVLVRPGPLPPLNTS